MHVDESRIYQTPRHDAVYKMHTKAMIDKVVQDLGGLDVMVANAGIALHGTLEETSVEDWDRILRVNLRGTFLQIKYAAAQMMKQGRGGRIISASSQAGKRGMLLETFMTGLTGQTICINGGVYFD